MFPIRKIKALYMPILMIVDALVFEFQEFNRKRRTTRTEQEEDEEHGNSVKVEITSTTCVSKAFLDF